MFNSRKHLLSIIIEYLTPVFMSTFFTFLLILPLFASSGKIIYGISALIFSFFVLLLLVLEAPFGVSYEIEHLNEAFLKEQIVKDFSQSPNYKKFVMSRIENADEFISSMKRVTDRINEVQGLAEGNDNVATFVNDCTYFDDSKEYLVFLLMNPEAYSSSRNWADNYIDDLYKYTVEYYISELNDDRYIPDVGPIESREKMIDKSNNIRDVIKQRYDDAYLKDIDMFLSELNFTSLTSNS